MKKEIQKAHWLCSKLMLVNILLLWPISVFALQPCVIPAADICQNPSSQSDCDQDGFSDYQECFEGVTMYSGKRLYGYGDTTAGPTEIKLNPASPDLLYIAGDINGNVPLANSLFEAALEGNLNGALQVYADGLKINTHRVVKNDCGSDRFVVDGPGGPVRAAMIRENLSTTVDGDLLGNTPSYVKPSDTYVSSVIYTAKIAEDVNQLCGQYSKCSVKGTEVTSNGTDYTPIVNYYILQVASHEMAHGSKLANTDANSYYHYRRSGTIMDPAASFRRGVFVIPTHFDQENDPIDVTLQ